jgi:imidazolonepropionase-like amidohydrolase
LNFTLDTVYTTPFSNNSFGQLQFRHAAAALGLSAEIGTMEVGKAADLAAWDVERPAELCYWLGKPLLHRRWRAGV